MKTVADFKRALKVGTKVHSIHHMCFGGRDEKGQPIWVDQDKGVREVSIVQSNSFALKTQHKEPTYGKDEFGNRIKTGETTTKMVDSWCSWPKATDCEFNPDGSITIFERDINTRRKVLTYKIIE